MRLIDADETRKKMLNSLDELFENVEMTGKTIHQKTLIRTIIHHIDDAQTIDVAPVKHGRWIDNNNKTWSCSICQSWIPDEQHSYARHCLHCGAKMDEKHEGKSADACFIDEPGNSHYETILTSDGSAADD